MPSSADVERVACLWLRQAAGTNPVLRVKWPKMPRRLESVTESSKGDPIDPKKKWDTGVKWAIKTLSKKPRDPYAALEDIEHALRNPRSADWDVFERKVFPKAIERVGPSQYKKAIELMESASNKLTGGYIKDTITPWGQFVSEEENWIFWEAVQATATELFKDWQFSSTLDRFKADALEWARERWQELWA